MQLAIHVWSPLLQATSSLASLQWHLRVSEFKVRRFQELIFKHIFHAIIIYNILVPASSTITLKSNVANHSRSSILIIGSDVKLTCTVELNSAILGFEIILLMVSAQMYKDDGTSLALTDPIVTGSTFTYTTQLKSFERNDFGNYTCIATIRPRPISTHLTGTSTILSDSLIIEAGKFAPANY